MVHLIIYGNGLLSDGREGAQSFLKQVEERLVEVLDKETLVTITDSAALTFSVGGDRNKQINSLIGLFSKEDEASGLKKKITKALSGLKSPVKWVKFSY